jgi:hypothetical protein
MKNLFMRTAWELLKSQALKGILARLSEANIKQRDAAPAFFEKLETLAEPYAKAFPLALNFVLLKIAFALVMMISFFALFSEALRQIDLLGGLAPGAYLIGYILLFVSSAAAFWLLKPPRVHRAASLEQADFHGYDLFAEGARDASAVQTPASAMAGAAPFQNPGADDIREFSNVEKLRRPTPLSASEIFLNELRDERALFLGHN